MKAVNYNAIFIGGSYQKRQAVLLSVHNSVRAFHHIMRLVPFVYLIKNLYPSTLASCHPRPLHPLQ
jgi:hypothetical protein